MKILVADDETAFRHLLEEILDRWGYEVVVAKDGNEAWQALLAADAPRLAILDWLMPGLNGVDICRQVRKELPAPFTYLILLTSQQRDEDLVAGMEAGADDYIVKPLKLDELRVRLKAGVRMVELQNELAAKASDLEAANRDLGSFSYTVANDMLKSLLSIGENANAIQEMVCNHEDQQCRGYTKRIYDKTRYLAGLIGSMQDYFRPTSYEPHAETFDLSRMVAMATEKLRLTNPERRVTFRIAGGIMITADKKMLQLVMNNLLDNALKYTVKREEAIIEFGETDIKGVPAYFVRDNGIGFDKEHVDKLFKPFQRLPGTEAFAGQGVGLATVERIIRRHGGKVWAEGEPGTGATFYFTL